MFRVLLFLFLFHNVAAQVSLSHLTCEGLVNPVGLDVAHPAFSWEIKSKTRNVKQTAYELRVAKSPAALSNGKNLFWESGKVKSDQSTYIEYTGPELQSRQRYYWQVRIWDDHGKATSWSQVAFWEMALLSREDWRAKWITSGIPADSVNGLVPMYRTTFRVSKQVTRARAYITSHGVYHAQINGKKIGDAFLTPGWTSYKKRLLYHVYDVQGLIKNGDNAIGATVGSGWYRGTLAWEGNKEIYGKKTSLLFQLELTFADGSTQTVVTDENWRTSTGPIRFSEIYDGEVYDARLELKDWTKPGFDDAGWKRVDIKQNDLGNLSAAHHEPVRKKEVISAKEILHTPRGETVIDFGQNLVGLVQFTIEGNAGDTIHLQHAEVLDKAGNFYTDNLRNAKAEVKYVCRGGDSETYEPQFTFMGFRYVKITGHQGEISPDQFKAHVYYSDMPVTGSFSCSHPLINQLQHNIEWGQKGNFLDVPTDCPQRDERLGWTGDAQVFFSTAAFNMHVKNFFTKWLQDLKADQLENGSVPYVIPSMLPSEAGASAGWADAATIIPYHMYIHYGDRRILEMQYQSMKAWVGFMENNSTDHLWNKGFHFGDWLFFRPDDDTDGRAAITDKYLIAQCFFAHSTDILAKTAALLGRNEDALRYRQLLENVKEAFNKEYVTASGRLVSSSQTAYVLALHFDMLPEGLRQQAAHRLVENIRSYGFHLTTGFLGTPYLCHVLTRFGHADIAYKLLMQETYPSWLYPVKMGATTIWERWDGQKPDGSFQNPGMNSFNHYAYGAIGSWMYATIAGINTDTTEVGFKKIHIKPLPGGGLTSAQGSLHTPNGYLATSWKIESGFFELKVEIPPNSSAIIYLPNASGKNISADGQSLEKVKDIKAIGGAGTTRRVTAGSGTYVFRYAWP